MAADSSSSTQLRPSLWEGVENPFTPTPMYSDVTVRQNHYTRVLPMDPGPSNSDTTLCGSSGDDIGVRQRPMLRKMKSRDSVTSSNKASRRTSFIDLEEVQSPSSGGLIGALKGRLRKKQSAPLLSNSHSAPPFYSSADYYSTSAGWDPSSSSSVPRDSYFSLKPKPSKSFRDERKRTAIPEEIIGGIGIGVKSTPNTLDETTDEETDITDSFEGVDISEGKYRAVPLRMRHGTLVHAYPPTEAPYTQSYNKVDLQTDFYFDTLLKRLRSRDTPTFHEYAVPPQEVLDLGCGEGTWVKDAAAAWAGAGTRVIGFDLVDLASKDASAPANSSWSLGNYVAFALPFRSKRFDLVRLSNLSASIPEARWEHVLMEVHRVLKPHGRVEIIDDELMFPYPEQSKRTSATLTPQSQRFGKRLSWASSIRSSPRESNATLEELGTEEPTSSFLDMDDQTESDQVSALCDDDSGSSNESLPSPEGSADAATLAESETTTMVEGLLPQSLAVSQAVESVYETMLASRQVHPRPAEFLQNLLWKVFGESGRTKLIKDFQLSLLSKPMHEVVVESKHMTPSDNPKRSNKLFKGERDTKRVDYDRAFMDKMAIVGTTGKALKLLGADVPSPTFDPLNTQLSDVSDSSVETMVSRPYYQRKRSSTVVSQMNSSRPSTSSSLSIRCDKAPYVPTGLFVYPDQFLETTPFELERYLFKHTDTLLSSKAALDAHVLSLADDQGTPLVSESEWSDLLWEYERTRRERYSLPDNGGKFDADEEEEDEEALREPGRCARTLFPAVASAILNEKSSSSTLVRRIRVFEAYKAASH